MSKYNNVYYFNNKSEQKIKDGMCAIVTSEDV